jgi:hypothetical protein
MVASINASTSAGVVTTADTSGILALQTAGTTALSISASQVVTLTNALPVASGGTGGTTSTGSGAVVLGTSPTITTPVISSLSSASATALTLQSAGTTAITVNTSQNVGIGTASPSAKLHVSGGQSYVTGASSAGAYSRWYNNAQTTGDFQVGQGWLSVSDNIGVLCNNANAAMILGTNGSERMRIDSSGYLLVGITVANYLGHNSSNSMNSDGSTHALSLTTDASGFAEGGGGLLPIGVLRSASSAYVFSGFYSGNGSTSAFSDKEFSFRGDGNGYADGTWNNNGADYAEYFESANGQALSVGSSVVLDGNKVRESTEQDDQSAIIGVVRPKEPSKASMVIGNTAWNKWANKYLTDDFDRYIMEDHDVLEWTDENGKSHSYESQNVPSDVVVPADAVRKTHDENGVKFQHYKINPEWNPDAEYVNRENRPEWNIIGLVGQVKLLKDQPVNARWIKMRDVSDSVEEWFIR